MPDLKVSLVQAELVWHDARANRVAFDSLLAPIEGRTDGVVLPEMLTEQAARLDAAVTGSIVGGEHGRCVNRLLWVTPDGATAHYDKRHLFRMARRLRRQDVRGDGHPGSPGTG